MLLTEVTHRRKYWLFGQKEYFVQQIRVNTISSYTYDYDEYRISPFFEYKEAAIAWKNRYVLYSAMTPYGLTHKIAHRLWQLKYNCVIPEQETKEIWWTASKAATFETSQAIIDKGLDYVVRSLIEENKDE